MKKLCLLVILTGIIVNLSAQTDVVKANGAKKAPNCPGAPVAWKFPKDVKAEEGEWKADDSICEKYKWLGPKPEGTVCALGCTSDGLEEMGMD